MKLREIKTKTTHFFIDEQGRVQDEFREWLANGQLYSQSFFVDNRLHGERKIWHENGQQFTICHYRYGKLHGESKMWYESGRLVEICHYRDNHLHGELKWWNHLGELIKHALDIDGEEVINFLENPELYPKTNEEHLMFVLKYGAGKLLSR